MKYFNKGKRGKIFLEGSIAIKKGEPKHILNEVKWLKKLNKYDIGPKLISSGKNYFRYKFVKGIFITKYIEERDKNKIKKVLINVLKQCRVLDKLKVNKLEMHNPYKHVIIGRKVVMIDFERCYETLKPKNVSQFCQFLISRNIKKVLDKKKIKIDKMDLIKLVKNYKRDYSKKDFNKILGFLQKT